MDDPRQDPQSKAKHQNTAERENEAGRGRDDHGQAVVGTMDRGGCHGCGVAFFPWLLGFPFCDSLVPGDVVRFAIDLQ